MKTSDTWKTQADVDVAANALLKEANGDIVQVTGNRVATHLGMPKANESIYTKFEDWKRRKIADGVLHIDQAPVDLREQLAGSLAQNSAAIADLVAGLAGKAIVAERAAAAETAKLLRERIAKLEATLEAARQERQRLDDEIGVLTERAQKSERDAAQNKLKAEMAEAKLDEARALNANLVLSLGAVSNRDMVAPVSAAAPPTATGTAGDDIDYSRYDLEAD